MVKNRGNARLNILNDPVLNVLSRLSGYRIPFTSRYLELNIGDFFVFWRVSPQWARASSFTRFLDLTQRRTTVGRTTLDE